MLLFVVAFFLPPAAAAAATLSQIGRKRPDEADSDMDDAMSEDSDEEWEDADHSDGVSGQIIFS